jgi:aryl-alcohol dehydrogenase-like predicted oxidoreductase
VLKKLLCPYFFKNHNGNKGTSPLKKLLIFLFIFSCFEVYASLDNLVASDKSKCLEALEQASTLQLFNAFLENQAKLYFDAESYLGRTYDIPVDVSKAYEELQEFLSDENAQVSPGLHFLVLRPLQTMNRELGNTGMRIKPIGFGAGQLSIGEYTEEPQALAILREAMNVYDLIDTADSYCKEGTDTGHNERLIAKVLKHHPRRHEVIIATKGGLIRKDLYNVDIDITPEHLREAVEGSLERLGVESIALYYLHAPDLGPNPQPNSFERAVQTLAALRQEGKIRCIGISNVTLEQIKIAEQITPITAVQNRLSFFDREDLENGVVDYCRERGITYVAYSPLRGRDGHLAIAQDEKLLHFAEEQNIEDPYQAALFWLLQQSPNIIPIPAARKMENLLSSAKVLQFWEESR